MKKLLGILSAGVLALSIVATPAFAINSNTTTTCDYCGNGIVCSDTDGNGICDFYSSYCGNNCGKNCASIGYCDSNNNGVCDYCGNTCLHIDADGDGICDLCTTTSYTSKTGSGCGSGHHGHHGGHHGHHGHC